MNPQTDSRKPGRIFVFSAPSGAGKTTILNHLIANVNGLVYSISATTRVPRPGEVDGTHYFFMSEPEFRERAARGEFAEWAQVHGNLYGTPRCFIDQTIASGLHVVMDIDVFGKKQFDTVYPDAIGILVLPPSIGVLEARLRGRGSDDEETIQRRIRNARTEMEFAAAQGKYEYTIVNDSLEKATREAVALVTSLIDP